MPLSASPGFDEVLELQRLLSPCWMSTLSRKFSGWLYALPEPLEGAGETGFGWLICWCCIGRTFSNLGSYPVNCIIFCEDLVIGGVSGVLSSFKCPEVCLGRLSVDCRVVSILASCVVEEVISWWIGVSHDPVISFQYLFDGISMGNGGSSLFVNCWGKGLGGSCLGGIATSIPPAIRVDEEGFGWCSYGL